jgi:hypothetical protein
MADLCNTENPSISMDRSKNRKVILVYLKREVGTNEEGGTARQYEPGPISDYMIFPGF